MRSPIVEGTTNAVDRTQEPFFTSAMSALKTFDDKLTYLARSATTFPIPILLDKGGALIRPN